MTALSLISSFKKKFESWINSNPLEYQNLAANGLKYFYNGNNQFIIRTTKIPDIILLNIAAESPMELIFHIHDLKGSCNLMTDIVLGDDKKCRMIFVPRLNQNHIRRLYPQGVELAEYVLKILGFIIIPKQYGRANKWFKLELDDSNE